MLIVIALDRPSILTRLGLVSMSSHFRLVTVRMSDVRCILHSSDDAIKVLSEFAAFLLSTRIKMGGCIKYLQR